MLVLCYLEPVRLFVFLDKQFVITASTIYGQSIVSGIAQQYLANICLIS